MISEHVAGVLEHKKEVGRFLQIVVSNLMHRAIVHDDSKFSPEEFEAFEQSTPRMKTLQYGSEEYRAALREIKPAKEHHYQANDHHPEHFERGINGMTLIELIEMVCDWMAATKRVQNGDIHRSLDVNRERFKIEPQLFEIIKNTVNQMIIDEMGEN